MFLSRAELLKQASTSAPNDPLAPTSQELQQWTSVFNTLFNRLSGHLLVLFPSTRAISSLPFGAASYVTAASALRSEIDVQDEPVWSFLAAMAVSSDMDQQQALVTGVREKVLECVTMASRKQTSPIAAAAKIKNVNLLLHALGLDASQITIDG